MGDDLTTETRRVRTKGFRVEGCGEKIRVTRVMAEKKQYEYFLLQYAPNAGNPSSMTMGIVMYEPGNPGGFAEVRLRRNWERLRCIDPEVDIEELEAIGGGLAIELRAPGREIFLKKIGESLSNVVQVMPVTGLLAEDAAKELDALDKFHLGVSHVLAARREAVGRQLILGQMRDQMEQAGVLGHMLQRFSLERFTRPGDPMKMDFAYPVGSEIKFLQAVSFSGDSKTSVDRAVILAARFPEIAAAIQAKENAKARLTAVVDDDIDHKSMEIGFALAMMREKGLRVVPVAEMPRIAQEISEELRA